MISTFTAFIDANVFFGARGRSLVLYLAGTKIFRARWSERVHDEWINAVHSKYGIDRAALEEDRSDMNDAVPDCLVTGFEALEQTLVLPDPNDRHVLAAAIVAGADVIVTFNTADFPADTLKPHHLETVHPDEFFLDAFDISPADFTEAVRRDFTRSFRNPTIPFEDYVERLRTARLPKTAARVDELRVLIET